MLRKILIANIKIDRNLRDGDDLSDMDQLVLAQPIVVRGDRLIDGLRRVKLAEKLGTPDLPAYDVTTLEEMSEALAKQHPTPLKDWDRVVELLRYLRPAMRERWVSIRQSTINEISGREAGTRPKGPSRPLVTTALGGTSSAHWECVEKIWREGSPELIEEVRSGKLSPSGALNRINRLPKTGNVTDPKDQEVLLEAAAQAIRSAVRSFEKLHRPFTVDRERLRELRDHLYKSRSALTTFINQSEEAVK